MSVISNGINIKRRNFLKWLLFGVGAFVVFLLGKIFGPSISLSSRPQKIEGDTVLKNFRITENDKELTLYNRFGDEIFIIEKDPEAGE